MRAMRKLFAGLIFFLGFIFIINYFSQLESMLDIARQGDWRYFALAVLVEFFVLTMTAVTLSAVFRSLGISRNIIRLLPITSSMNFITFVAPSGGMSSLAVLIADAKRNRVSSAHATVAGALFVLVEYLSFTFFLTLGLIALFRSGSLNTPELVASAILWIMALTLATILYLGSRSERRLSRVLRRISRFVNKLVFPFRKRDLLEEDRAEIFAKQIADGLTQVKEQPRKLLLAIFTSAISKTFMIAIFALMFLAFRVPLFAPTVFAAFALAYLFVIVSPTPAGLGIVEGIVTLSLASLHVPVSAAALIVLGYRAITFWLPLFVGMIAAQSLSLRSGKSAASETN